MRNGFLDVAPVKSGLTAVLVLLLCGCAAKAPGKGAKAAADLYKETPVPTVPPATPTPEAAASPIPTRPIGKGIKATKGKPIGPVITYFGAARADGGMVQPESVDAKGIPTFLSAAGAGFQLVVEAKAGLNGAEPGRRVFVYVPGDPKSRPDLEIEANRDMGDGSPKVCDRMKPEIGGIPGINPANFSEKQKITDAINDFSCRFEIFLTPDSACTVNKNGDFAFEQGDSMIQFCMVVARAWSFPPGETLLSVRLRDTEGNPGPIKQMRIKRPPTPVRPKKK